jgi:ribonuclease P protein component
MLHDGLEKKYALMFFYQTKDRLSFEEIHEKTIQLFEKFQKTIKE